MPILLAANALSCLSEPGSSDGAASTTLIILEYVVSEFFTAQKRPERLVCRVSGEEPHKHLLPGKPSTVGIFYRSSIGVGTDEHPI
jgi:hypothetical protein